MAGARGLRAARRKPEYFRFFLNFQLFIERIRFLIQLRPFFAHPDFIEYTKTAYPGTGTVKPLYTVLLGETKNARYREVHGIERYVLHVNTAKHGIWGRIPCTVYRGTRSREARYREVLLY